MTEDRADNTSSTAADPLALPVQQALGRRAARLLARLDLQPTLDALRAHWRDSVQPNAEQLALFEFEFEQTAFCGAMNALNDNGGRPALHAFGRFAHELDGMRIPGTKHGHPNPDYIYWFAPVDDRSHYVITGSTGGLPPIAAEFSLLDAKQVYQGNLSVHQIVTDPAGNFTITLDPDPAGERPNHLQSKPGAWQLLVRNVLSDLRAERPMTIRIERLGATPPTTEEDDDAVAARVGRHIRKLIDDLLWVNANLVYARPVNRFDEPTIHDGGVYSVSQAYAPGHYRLADDEALLFRLTLGNADYAVVPVTNVWGGLGHYLDHVGSLGTGRAEPDADGGFTIVVSMVDPGIANWVDPAGQHEGVIFVRWVGFRPENRDRPKPTLECRLLKLAELSALLPAGTRRVTPDERAAQRARHREDYLAVTG